ncbi:hypothetical protein OE88DRAFT_1296612 [Heliocybe sulcata]|uniref:Uncharacterized protein n=1 Tax=Heliocybe sulcata TaxID=5364 RepID=A0A5C3N9Y0_9AGAM|nr:hypothetical protein OE88DRAFT_1296612 [Heliocybe sulcata]
MVFHSLSSNTGRLVRVFLLAIVADHPAMCKLCGFADHRHKEAPCTKCHVPHDELFSEESLRNEYQPRNGDEHKARCWEYKNLQTEEDKNAFFQEFGSRWTEFARLKYFDLVRYTLIDPMHNMLLGLAKNQWYVRWIQTKSLRAPTPKSERELGIIHRFLGTFESPLWAGNLPLKVGEPAGGSLTADEYKFATTVPFPIIIPTIWDLFLETSHHQNVKDMEKYTAELEEYKRELEDWESREAQRKKRSESSLSKTKGKGRDDPKPESPTRPSQRLDPEEPGMFLGFATALKLLLGRSIDERTIVRALELLQDYLLQYREIYGEEAMKPNHHWVVHQPDQIRDYGPVYGFWLFLIERLNKILKNYNTNSQKRGQMEITLMRQFGRDKRAQSVIIAAGKCAVHPAELKVAQRLLDRPGEERGTVQAAASGSDRFPRCEALDDAGSLLHIDIGPPTSRSRTPLSSAAIRHLHDFYNTNGERRVYYHTSRDRPRGAHPISTDAVFYEYAILDGRRIIPTSRNLRKNCGSSIVKVSLEGQVLGGELVAIFHHPQKGADNTILWAEMRWMKELDLVPVEGDPWRHYPELELRCWALDEYHDSGDPDAPPRFIPFPSIQCQLARGRCDWVEPALWVTITLDRHPTAFFDEADDEWIN